MKILDWYILKRYLFTFLMMLLLFIPIGITVNLAENIGNAGKEHVRKNFLITRHLKDYVNLLKDQLIHYKT